MNSVPDNFEHFLSYSGYWKLPEDVKLALKHAYFDGANADYEENKEFYDTVIKD